MFKGIALFVIIAIAAISFASKHIEIANADAISAHNSQIAQVAAELEK